MSRSNGVNTLGTSDVEHHVSYCPALQRLSRPWQGRHRQLTVKAGVQLRATVVVIDAAAAPVFVGRHGGCAQRGAGAAADKPY